MGLPDSYAVTFGKGVRLSLGVLGTPFWWILIIASFPVSYYSFGTRPANVRVPARRQKWASMYLVGSFISYVLWLLAFRPGSGLFELSPFAGFLIAVLFPWALGLRKKA
ncbi:MAG: hypothetical protein QW057_04875 [Candidatus Bathyarchaeia archaeon]